MGASQSASAAGWDACAAPFLAPVKPATDPPPTDPTAYGVSADSAELVSGGVSTLRGDVHVVRGSELLTADELIYDEAGQQLNASGHVKYWEGGFHLSSDKADVDIDNDHIDANGANFLDEASHARGEAGRIQLFGSDLVKGEDVKYTTCMPAREDWSLVARNLDLDYVTDVGTARDVKVFFKDIPIFYSPYLTFPLSDKRKSGFLAPSARLSGPAGLEVLVPYYFNLAPNRDALVTTRLTTKRGAILIG
ncbi:MAG: hypothetical protein K0U93_11915, partial [Gammaproteobacteria bacterium]|nr:hypothetical protein [Gammaproteobacteria bacterium]